jgi:hypothetical protein
MSMTTPKLIYLISSLNHLVDHGFDATIVEVHDHVEGGNLFAWLRRKFTGHIDLSPIGSASEQEIMEGLQDIFGGYGGYERRKFGVQNSGLCLLIAWLAELAQRRAWKDEHAKMELSQ